MDFRSVAAVAVAMSTLALAGSCATPAPSQGTASSEGAVRNNYARSATWLCRPGRRDACRVDLTTTIVAADGSLTREVFRRNPNPPVDCFYVYPTVSRDPGGNSDMLVGPEERNAVAVQFARFAQVCRTFAPVYRQRTLTSLRASMAGQPMQVDRDLAHQDVVEAWRYYLDHDNRGRGVVLIGHSQGATILTRLLAEEFEGKAVQAQLVSALLIGSNVAVPRGRDVGGALHTIPACRSAEEYGCLIAFVSFRDTALPTESSPFAHVAAADQIALCTNPANLAGGEGALHSYLTAAPATSGLSNPGPSWTTPSQPIATRFVSTPGLVTAQCRSDEHGSYLSVHVNADASDPRVDDIPGDVVVDGDARPDWGLHLVDMQLALGNLIDVVQRQGVVYQGAVAREQ